MKVIALFLIFFFHSHAYSYVPTVESLFRGGDNPEVTQNAASLAGKIVQVDEQGKEEGAIWVKVIYHFSGSKIHYTQLIYNRPTFSDTALVSRAETSSLTPETWVSNDDKAQKGLFFSLVQSLLFNDGKFLVQFLRLRGAKVALNSEILNQEKIALLMRHKKWLQKTNGGKNITDEESPLLPKDAGARERVAQLMKSPMFKQEVNVELKKNLGVASWSIDAPPFLAWVDDKDRSPQELHLKTESGEMMITTKKWGLFNAQRRLPREIFVKTISGKSYKWELSSYRSFNESSSEMSQRIRKENQALHTPESPIMALGFLL